MLRSIRVGSIRFLHRHIVFNKRVNKPPVRYFEKYVNSSISYNLELYVNKIVLYGKKSALKIVTEICNV